MLTHLEQLPAILFDGQNRTPVACQPRRKSVHVQTFRLCAFRLIPPNGRPILPGWLTRL